MAADVLGELRNSSRMNYASGTSANVEASTLPQMPFSSELDTFSGFFLDPFYPWPDDELTAPLGVASYVRPYLL